MNDDPRKRPDFSRFLVHLTRDLNGVKADENLISILKAKTIEARNFHCLFGPKLKRMKLSSKLKEKFQTVCFTETPLDQIYKMASVYTVYKMKLELNPI